MRQLLRRLATWAGGLAQAFDHVRGQHHEFRTKLYLQPAAEEFDQRSLLAVTRIENATPWREDAEDNLLWSNVIGQQFRQGRVNVRRLGRELFLPVEGPPFGIPGRSRCPQIWGLSAPPARRCSPQALLWHSGGVMMDHEPVPILLLKDVRGQVGATDYRAGLVFPLRLLNPGCPGDGSHDLYARFHRGF